MHPKLSTADFKGVVYKFFPGEVFLKVTSSIRVLIVQELCESRGGRPGLSVLTSLMVSVDVKLLVSACP